MDWKEILTLILSFISAAGTIIVAFISANTSKKVSKINNIKEYKENNRHINPFELQFRDEEWLYDIIVNKDEFYKYDESSQKRIAKWFQKYAETHTLTKLIPVDVETKLEVQKPEEQKETEADEQPEEIVTQIGPRQVTIVDPEVIKMIRARQNLANVGGPRVKLPKGTKVNLRDYPIGSSTITRTPIITDLEDEFDIEDDKK